MIEYYGTQKWDFSKAKWRTDTERIEFLSRNLDTSFEELGDQENNLGHKIGLFSICSQHLMGDSMRELIDAAIYCEENPNGDTTPIPSPEDGE